MAVHVVNPTEDSWVDQATPNTNHGTDTVLRAALSVGGARWIGSFLKFNIPDVAIDQVFLRLYVTLVTPPFSGQIMINDIPDYSWAETEINYNNRPTAVGDLTEFYSYAALFDYWTNIDITEFAKANKGKTVTLMISGFSEGVFMAFSSKEGTNKPNLLITYTEAEPDKAIAHFTSEPSGADIFRALVDTGQDTPYTLSQDSSESFYYTYKKSGYEDERFLVHVLVGEEVTFHRVLTPTAPPEEKGGIIGKVTDSITGNPINAVGVGVNSLTTITTSAGTYSITDIPVGDYEAAFIHPDYVNQFIPVTIQNLQNTVVDVALTPLEVPPEVTLIDKIKGVFIDVFHEGLTVQDALAKWGIIPGIVADVINQVIDFFTINIAPPGEPPLRIMIIAAAPVIKAIPGLTASQVDDMVLALSKGGASKILSNIVSHPEGMKTVIASLSDDALDKLFRSLAASPTGRIALAKLTSLVAPALSSRAATAIGTSTIMSGAPAAFIKFIGIIWLLKFIGFDLPGYIAIFRKEIPESTSIAVWGAIENAEREKTLEAWQLAKKANDIYLKFIDMADRETSAWLVLNPWLQEIYSSSSDAQRAQHGIYEEIIQTGLAAEPEVPPEEMGTLTVSSIPSGAKIYLDGTYTFESTNTTINVSPGTHNLTLKMEGYEDYSEDFSILARENYIIDATLTPIVTDITINISSIPPGAKIYIDNDYIFETTNTTITAPAGAHTLTLKLDGYKDHNLPYDWPAGSVKNMQVTLELLDGDDDVVDQPADEVVIPLVPVEEPSRNAWEITIKGIDSATNQPVSAWILIDDDFKGVTTPAVFYLAPEQTYNIKLRLAGYRQGEVTYTTLPLPTT